MNIPAYQKKDYSYMPTAFGQLQQGIQSATKGIASAMDIGDRERKRKQEDELLAQLKISREDAEKVRETAIVEAATQIKEAMGLPDDEAGHNRALDIASQIYYKPTAKEWQDGSATLRVYKQEQDELPKLLNKLKMNRFREEYQKGTVEEQIPQRQSIQEPAGTVGVESEQGAVKKPLSTAPQNVQELQQQADKEMVEQPQLQPTVTRERSADDFYKLGVELGITEQPEFKGLMSTLSRQDIMNRERDKPITQQQYAKEALAEPVVPTSELVSKLPSEMSEADKERLNIQKMRALRPTAGTDQTSKDIREETKRDDRLSSEILKYTEKINRLRQARVKLESGKTPDEKIKQMLTGLVTNPDNPDINEINSEIEKLHIYTEGLKESRQEARDRITELGKGKSLANVVTGEAEKEQAIINQGVDHIRSKIKPVTSQFTTTAQIINMLPSMFKKPIRQKVEEMRGMGMSDKEIADRLLGR